MKRITFSAVLFVVVLLIAGTSLVSGVVVSEPQSDAVEAAAWATEAPRTFYRTEEIDGLEIFYREAGPADAPTILLLHGFRRPRKRSRH